MTEAQRRAKKNYKKKVTRLYLDLYPTDADIKERLNDVGQKSKYIKFLIREDIERRKTEALKINE